MNINGKYNPYLSLIIMLLIISILPLTNLSQDTSTLNQLGDIGSNSKF